MQCTVLPQKVCQSLDRIQSNFLWGSLENHRKLWVVKWNLVTTPKDQGGLVVCKTEGRRIALFGNFFRRATKKSKHWVQLMQAQYMGPFRPSEGCKNDLDYTAMETREYTFMLGGKWAVGDGSRIKMWSDLRLHQGPLRSLISGPLANGEMDRNLNKLQNSNGSWNLTTLSFELPGTHSHWWRVHWEGS